MRLNEVKSWGIDIGNVLIKNIPYKTRQLYADHQIAPEVIVNHLQLLPDALLGLRFLVHQVGKQNVWIISKANNQQIPISRLAFQKFKIPQVTGFDMEQMLFVPERLDKAPVIQSLELEGHIDDRGEIIVSVQDIVKCPIWFKPDPKDSVRWVADMKYNIRVVSSWRQFMEMF